MRLGALVAGMPPSSTQGSACCVPQKYLHISLLQAIDTKEAMVTNQIG